MKFSENYHWLEPYDLNLIGAKRSKNHHIILNASVFQSSFLFVTVEVIAYYHC